MKRISEVLGEQVLPEGLDRLYLQDVLEQDLKVFPQSIFGRVAMPLSTRQWAHRKLEQAQGCTDWAIYHLTEVLERYEGAVPRVAAPLAVIIKTLDEVKKALARLEQSF